MSIAAGEILTVSRDNVGDGWCEGYNQSGSSGLFPAAYVQLYDSQQQTNTASAASAASAAIVQSSSTDYWDDDWDDDSEIGQTQAYVPKNYATTISTNTGYNNNNNNDYSDNMSVASHSIAPDRNIPNIPKKDKKFSTLIKSGEDSFLLGVKTIIVPEYDKIFIEEHEDGRYSWLSTGENYKCVVTSPKKESKLKGLKSFIVYQLTSTFNNIQVSRRYKHFDWLHDRLEEKYCFIAIPPLPDKQISGRYEEQFIEHRRTQLQEFVDYVCRHPVLSKSRVWEHFITCTDEKRWKAGKRLAEKDELLGFNYFNAVQCSDTQIDVIKTEIQIDTFTKFINGLDPVVKNFMAMAMDQGKKHQSLYKREYQKIGQSFTLLGHALEGDACSRNQLTLALKLTGDAYNDIGKLYEEQPKYDWEPLAHKFHIYRGIIGAFPDIINIHKSAVQKKKDCERLVTEHKMELQQHRELSKRTDVIARTLIAEESYFQTEREMHIKPMVQNHLREQIIFYQNIVTKLQEALAAYDA